MNLDQAIEQLINLGEVDPFEIAKKLEKRHGSDWLREEAALRAYELAVDRARERLNAHRRAAMRSGDLSALRVSGAIPPNERSEWLDGFGWKPLLAWTAEEHLAKAAHYRKLAAANEVQAEKHETWAALISSHGVLTLAELAPSVLAEAA